MSSNSPVVTTPPVRGRGRGRPRLYPPGTRGTVPALSRRRSGGSQRSGDTPSSSRRRIPLPHAGYRPGGAGGGGRYIHPTTGEEIPASIFKEMIRKGDLKLEAWNQLRKTVIQPQPPTVGGDGVYKPREERSYSEFHPGFDTEKSLFVYTAQEVDGEYYKPPPLENKAVKIVDVKEEDDKFEGTQFPAEVLKVRGQTFAETGAYPPSPSVNGLTPNYGAHDPILNTIEGTDIGSSYSSPMDDVQLAYGDDAAVDPALTALTPPPASIDPALVSQSELALSGSDTHRQVHTPATTPTDGTSKEHSVHLGNTPPPVTPAPSRRGIDNTPTLASTRPHRTNAGKPPKPPPPPPPPPSSSSRRSRPRDQNAWGDEKLNLRAPSFRPIQPYKYSEVAWNGDIGSAGGFGINNLNSSTEGFSRNIIAAGYQRSSAFKRPRILSRDYPDAAIDEELGCGRYDFVEYDMDEQDDKWLTNYNNRRASDDSIVSQEMFEIAMTKIEKDWVNLEKRIPKVQAKPHGAGFSSRRRASGRTGEDDEEGAEDSKCAICDDGECENANAIVFCDGCNLAVHQECYGVPYIPEGQWHCRKCQQIPKQTANCVFCPNTDGAFKMTSTNRWAHLLCAIWIPEVRLANPAFMEPVEGMEEVPKSRWKLTCYICKQRMGACIQCSNKNCYLAFHVTCARRARLHLKMKNASGMGALLEPSSLKALCDKHVPNDWRRENDVEYAVQEAMEFYNRELGGREWGDSQAAAVTGPCMPSDDEVGGPPRVNLKVVEKRKRSSDLKSMWKLPSGAPIIPRALCENLVGYLAHFEMKGVQQFATEICRYWTLKREARRGACLIRRLQIQSDSSSFTSVEVARKNYGALGKTQGGRKLLRRKEFINSLEKDLQRLVAVVSDPNNQTWEAPESYAKHAEMLRSYVDSVYFPELPLIRGLLTRAREMDTDDLFEYGFYLISDRVEHRLYPSVNSFAIDIRSVLQSPSNSPQLDFNVNIAAYVAPAFKPKTCATDQDDQAISAAAEKILHALEAMIRRAVFAEKGLWEEMEERPAKRICLSDGSTMSGKNLMPAALCLDVKRSVTPSAQLVNESASDKPGNAPPLARSVLGPLAPNLVASFQKGKWNKTWPRWFVNEYRSEAAKSTDVTESDYEKVTKSRYRDLDTLPSPPTPPPPPSPPPIDVPLQAPPTPPSPTKVEGTTHSTDISSMDGRVDPDEDMEDAPGELDEEFLPLLPQQPLQAPSSSALDPLIENNEHPHVHSDLHDEDAEGEIDDEIPAPLLQGPPPPPPRLPEYVPTIITEIRPVYHEDIRRDDNLLGGYRSEDLPSPLGSVGEPSPTPGSAGGSNGAVAAIVQVAMASNPPPSREQTHAAELSPLLAQNGRPIEKAELEDTADPDSHGNYPDEDVDGEYEVDSTPRGQNGEVQPKQQNGETTLSPGAKKSRKGMAFKRDSNGRFGKVKTQGATSTGTLSRSRRRKR